MVRQSALIKRMREYGKRSADAKRRKIASEAAVEIDASSEVEDEIVLETSWVDIL